MMAPPLGTLGGLVAQAQPNLAPLLASPFLWGALLAAIGLWLAIPDSRQWLRGLGAVLALAGFFFIALAAMLQWPLADWWHAVLFWLLAAITLATAAAAITMRSALYAAVWFALSLIGTAGLFLLQGAQFLGVATVVVYAGAIVVTFLFVIMLAQPRGHEPYDRMTWGAFAKPFTLLAALALAVILFGTLTEVQSRLQTVGETGPAAEQMADKILHPQHVASLGTELFTRHLVAVEIAGVLLLVALVGAIAFALQGKQPEGPRA